MAQRLRLVAADVAAIALVALVVPGQLAGPSMEVTKSAHGVFTFGGGGGSSVTLPVTSPSLTTIGSLTSSLFSSLFSSNSIFFPSSTSPCSCPKVTTALSRVCLLSLSHLPMFLSVVPKVTTALSGVFGRLGVVSPLPVGVGVSLGLTLVASRLALLVEHSVLLSS